MGTEMEVILGLCRIPYERARMTDQEPKTERALTVEDHAKRQRESCEIGCSIFPQGETVIVTSRELTILSLFFFPPSTRTFPPKCSATLSIPWRVPPSPRWFDVYHYPQSSIN